MFLTFYTTAEISRFFKLLDAMNTVSSNLIELGIIFGSVHLATNMSTLSRIEDLEQRRWLFKLYRYLNLYHWLAYKDTVFSSNTNASNLLQAGLVLESEVPALEASGYSYSAVSVCSLSPPQSWSL